MEYKKQSLGKRILRITGWIIGGLLLATLLAFVFGYVVMYLWNWIMPALFDLPEITYWMAFGIILLAKILFGGFTGKHHHSDNCHEPHKKEFYKQRFKHGDAPGFKEFGKWKYYGDFWKEEGEKAYENFIERKKNPESI